MSCRRHVVFMSCRLRVVSSSSHVVFMCHVIFVLCRLCVCCRLWLHLCHGSICRSCHMCHTLLGWSSLSALQSSSALPVLSPMPAIVIMPVLISVVVDIVVVWRFVALALALPLQLRLSVLLQMWAGVVAIPSDVCQIVTRLWRFGICRLIISECTCHV